MPDDVLNVSKCFMRNPVRILVKKEELTLEGNKRQVLLCWDNNTFFASAQVSSSSL
jgi:hypothetical protein